MKEAPLDLCTAGASRSDGITWRRSGAALRRLGLARFVVAGDDVELRCRSIARWVHADSLWQRRAGAVAVVEHAATEPELFDGFSNMLIQIADVNVADPTRWSQTSVGWLLRELARCRPEKVSDFVDAHAELSREARINATKGLLGPARRWSLRTTAIPFAQTIACTRP